MANTRTVLGVGSVPLGEETWSCFIKSKWQDRSVTITALTTAGIEKVRQEAKEAQANEAAEAAAKVVAQKQAAHRQTEKVRLLMLALIIDH